MNGRSQTIPLLCSPDSPVNTTPTLPAEGSHLHTAADCGAAQLTVGSSSAGDSLLSNPLPWALLTVPSKAHSADRETESWYIQAHFVRYKYTYIFVNTYVNIQNHLKYTFNDVGKYQCNEHVLGPHLKS